VSPGDESGSPAEKISGPVRKLDAEVERELRHEFRLDTEPAFRPALFHVGTDEQGTGVRSAVEYTCDRWGSHDLPPRAGLGVYERGPDGLLAAVRAYDDIEAPFPGF
jgi:hypothetical protein